MIGFSFGLTPKEALSFFAAKGLEPRFAWQDMLHEAHDHAIGRLVQSRKAAHFETPSSIGAPLIDRLGEQVAIRMASVSA